MAWTLRPELLENGFPFRLGMARLNANYTQERASIALETSISYIARVEGGWVNPGIGFVMRAAKLYNCDLNWLCGMEDDDGTLFRGHQRTD